MEWESAIRLCIARERLQLILMPTEACNFRCVYCYEDFKLRRMEPRVVRGIKNLLDRRAAGLETLWLSWFGGEPLLALDIVRDIQTHARRLAERHPNLRVVSDMTTNAYLLSPRVFEELLDLGVTEYQVTFDGPRELHDRRRVLAGGRGTFDRIWKNVRAMAGVSKEFDVVIRLHVSRDNAGDLPRFVDLYRAAFGRDPRFKLHFRPLSRLGGRADTTPQVLQGDDERGQVLEDLRRLAADRGVATVNEAEVDPICYAVHTNSYVVRADGRLNKCTVALEHPANQVGQMLEDGTLRVSEPRMQTWLRGLYSGDARELMCPMRGVADPPAAR